MCGIVGYVGKKNAHPILLKGLQSLEYRGYDSAGLAVLDSNGKVSLLKRTGKVTELAKAVATSEVMGNLGIAHTRWATHGVPSEENAHPHFDCQKRVFIVHNGIIENADTLRCELQTKGHLFCSQTDTEVIAHLIEEELITEKDFFKAFKSSIAQINGAYAIVAIDINNPDTLYAAKLSSPLVIGEGDGELYVASDPSALLEYTNNVVYLKDNELAIIKQSGIVLQDIEGRQKLKELVDIDWDFERSQKGDFSHYMLKEIFEAPEVVEKAFAGRIRSKEGDVKLGGLIDVADRLRETKSATILACGTSYYASLIGARLLEEIAHIPTQVEISSEFRYREKIIAPHSMAIAVSQSGETADTLAAIKKAKEKEMLTLGIVNTVGSSIARETDAGVYNRAGQEIGVASTKAFISQLTVFLLIASHLSGDRALCRQILGELEEIPLKIKKILINYEQIKSVARKYIKAQSALFIGRGYNFPVAMEGALKLKEISYLHAEGFAAGELKHGPIAMVDAETPTIAIVTDNSVREKMISNLREVKARGGKVFAIANEGDKEISKIADDVFFIPKTLEPLEPLLTIVPLQIFAYEIGIGRGLDVDMPRNLAKSVTVE